MNSVPSGDEKAQLSRSVLKIWPIDEWKDSKVVVGVSGGPDSVALLTILSSVQTEHSSNGLISAVYCHHATRQACDAERDFVEKLAADLGCSFFARDLDPSKPRPSEESFRDFRYGALKEVAAKIGARYVATGHHADDQIETVLFRILRGTSISGLVGIPPIRVEGDITIVRPFLQVSKNQISKFLTSHRIRCCHDTSNDESIYSRNFIRNEIIPILDGRFGEQWKSSVLRLTEQASELEDCLHMMCQNLMPVDFCNEINIGALVNQHPAVIKHWLKSIWREFEFPEQEMTADKWNDLCQSIQHQHQQRFQLPGGITANLTGQCLTFERTNTPQRRQEKS